MSRPLGALPGNVPLFRAEAVAHRASTLFGSIMVPAPRFASVVAAAAVVAAACIVGVVSFGQYTSRVHTVGWIATAEGEARILSPAGGIVTEVLVREGAQVAAGAALMVLSTDRRSTSGSASEATIADLNRAREGLLRQQEAEVALSHAARARLEAQVQSLERGIEQLASLRSTSRQRLELARADLGRSRTLFERGLVASMAVDKAADAVLQAQMAADDAEHKHSEAQAGLKLKRQELAEAPLLLERRQAEMHSQLAEIDRRIGEIRASADVVVQAPIAGRVSGLVARRGQSVPQGATLTAVVPDDATLQAELLIPSRAAGFLKEGMPVRLRYDAFPYQKFGQHDGTIAQVGRVVLAPAEQTGPLRLNEPAYLATVRLRNDHVSGYGQAFPLRSGLTLQADVMQEQRRVIDWVLDPIYAAGRTL
jgi:membrane fusion protein